MTYLKSPIISKGYRQNSSLDAGTHMNPRFSLDSVLQYGTSSDEKPLSLSLNIYSIKKGRATVALLIFYL